MEGPRYPPVFDAPLNPPASPPTPRCPYLAASHYIHLHDPPPPYEQHVDSAHPAPSPPQESAERKAPAYKFFFPQTQGYTSSADSSDISSPSAMEDDSSADDSDSLLSELPHQEDKPIITVKDGDFDVEEITEDDIGYDSDVEVVRPDGFEEATGAKNLAGCTGDDAGISESFEELNCDDESVNTDEELRRRMERKKRRWSTRPFKRTHSQIVGSDTDDADLDGLGTYGAGSGARRLRRKLNGGRRERSSLIFEDVGEGDDEEEHASSASMPPDTEGLQSLPFWVLQENRMELDSGSSGPPSVA
ncbi:e3 ubiquitin-protein ligase mgrn1-like [Diplodia corticola]|uniref:E3 ubiquitin-protein ligase mgrn1-like n=1 Tax=Diplodia corticola TaxID=236234 RepID=A0A1J9QXC9_9PEZI|nr:e3 ubiquitin-protein ligase mgrn1-like [Diplodia corticola]OJD32642.1 e3 ubiquitin-protein ligase mgrn1-like [Diplodia corticola]